VDNIRRIVELTQPAVEPITLAELKTHLRITNTADDDWLTAAIKAARVACEDYTCCVFIRRTFRQTCDTAGNNNAAWWDGVRQVSVSVLSPSTIEVLKRPLVSVEAMTTYDDSDTGVVVASSVYFIDSSDTLQQGRVILRRGQAWPIVLRVANGLTIDFTAGFAASAAGLPADIVLAVKMVASHLYANRGDCSCDTAGANMVLQPSGAGMLLASYRPMRF
jgi:uncharacterized phiE125 gp8 family phage protein